MKRDPPHMTPLELPPDAPEMAANLLQPRQDFIAAKPVASVVCFSEGE
jgi:hypothetical protein